LAAGLPNATIPKREKYAQIGIFGMQICHLATLQLLLKTLALFGSRVAKCHHTKM
jgi:hypothetical protein